MTRSPERLEKSLRLPDGTEAEALDFRALLGRQLVAEGLRKGERTRCAIQLAACELLEELPLGQLKVQDICGRAGIAMGTFYIYFRDRNHVLNVALEGFVEFVQAQMIQRSRDSGPDAARVSTLVYYLVFERNRGLMKCLLSYYEEFPEARRIARDFNRAWIETVVRAVKRRLERQGCSGALADEELYRRCHALGGMVDQYLAYLFLYGDENVAAVSGDPAAVVETLTHIWTRALDVPKEQA